MSPMDKSKLLNTLADLVDKHADDLGQIESLNLGMPLGDAVGCAHLGATTLRYTHCNRGRWIYFVEIDSLLNSMQACALIRLRAGHIARTAPAPAVACHVCSNLIIILFPLSRTHPVPSCLSRSPRNDTRITLHF